MGLAQVGQAWQKGYAERLMRTIKEEEIALMEYQDFHYAYSQIGRFLEEVYQHKRIHSALGYLTPAELAEFEQSWREQRAAQPGELKLPLLSYRRYTTVSSFVDTVQFRVQFCGYSTLRSATIAVSSSLIRPALPSIRI